MYRRIFTAVAAFVFAGAISAPTTQAMAEPLIVQSQVATRLSADQVEELETFFDYYDVSLYDQKRLIEKLERGQLWDSMSGVAPQVVEENVISGEKVRIERYHDGSVVASSVEIPIVDDVSLSFKGFPVGTTFWVEAHVGMGDTVWTVHKYSKKG